MKVLCLVISSLLLITAVSMIASGTPQYVLRIRVTGDETALNTQLYLTIKYDDNYRTVTCKLSQGVCDINVETPEFTVVAVRLGDHLVVARMNGTIEVVWGRIYGGNWQNTILSLIHI